MSRRIDIELTSRRDDGTWTWRAAGAKQPKGELGDALVPGASVGDVLRAEADFLIDGIEIVSIVPTKTARKEPELLEIRGSGRQEELVTTRLVSRGGGDRRGRPDRGRPGGDRGEGSGRGPRRDGERRPSGPRDGRGRSEERSEPRAKRLRPGRAHRDAVLDTVALEQRPIAEQILRGGLPAVREAIQKQNAEASAEGRPELPADQIEAMAEQLLPKLRAADWRDRADAALASLDEVDLRDLRSVVVAADTAGKDAESRDLAERLREALVKRVESEHQAWLSELERAVKEGRTVRALRLSSRPPKAGAPLPTDLATQLAAQASAALTAETPADRYATVLDALTFSPVRTKVVPEGRPAEADDDLIAAVTRVASKLPAVAALFGISESAAPKGPPRGPRKGAGKLPPPPPPVVAASASSSESSEPEPDMETPADVVAEQTPPSAPEPDIETPTEVVAEAASEEPPVAPFETDLETPPEVAAEAAMESSEPADEEPAAADLPDA